MIQLIHYTRTGHIKNLRQIAIDLYGVENVAYASDGQVVDMLSEDGWSTYAQWTGEYDDGDYLLLVKEDAIRRMLQDGTAKEVNR